MSHCFSHHLRRVLSLGFLAGYVLLPFLGTSPLWAQDDRATRVPQPVIRDPFDAELRATLGQDEMIVVGDRQTYNDATGALTLTGSPYILTSEDFISATEIRYFRERNVAEAVGEVRIRNFEGDAIAFSDFAEFNTETRDFNLRENARLYVNNQDLVITGDRFDRLSTSRRIDISGNVRIRRNFDGALLTSEKAVYFQDDERIELTGQDDKRPILFYEQNEYEADRILMFSEDDRARLEGDCEIRLGEFRLAKADTIDVRRGASEDSESICGSPVTTRAVLTGRASVVENSLPESILGGDVARRAAADVIVYQSNARCERVTGDGNARIANYRPVAVTGRVRDDDVVIQDGQTRYRIETTRGFAKEISLDLAPGGGFGQKVTLTNDALVTLPNIVGIGDEIIVRFVGSDVDADFEGNAAVYQGYTLEELMRQSGQTGNLERVNRRLYGSTIRVFKDDRGANERQRITIEGDETQRARIQEGRENEQRTVTGHLIEFYDQVSGGNASDLGIGDPNRGQRVEVFGDESLGIQANVKDPNNEGWAQRIDYYTAASGSATLSGGARFIRLGEDQVATAERMYVTGLSGSNTSSGDVKALLVGDPVINERNGERIVRANLMRISQESGGYAASLIGNGSVIERDGNELEADLIDFRDQGDDTDQLVMMHGNVKLTTNDASGSRQTIFGDQGVYRRLVTKGSDGEAPIEALLNGNVRVDTDDGQQIRGERLRYYRPLEDASGFVRERFVLVGSGRPAEAFDNDTQLEERSSEAWLDETGKVVASQEIQVTEDVEDPDGSTRTVTKDRQRRFLADILEYEPRPVPGKDPYDTFTLSVSQPDDRVILVETDPDGTVRRLGKSQRVEVEVEETPQDNQRYLERNKIILIGAADVQDDVGQANLVDSYLEGERITFEERTLEDRLAGQSPTSQSCETQGGRLICLIEKLTSVRIEGLARFEKPFYELDEESADPDAEDGNDGEEGETGLQGTDASGEATDEEVPQTTDEDTRTGEERRQAVEESASDATEIEVEDRDADESDESDGAEAAADAEAETSEDAEDDAGEGENEADGEESEVSALKTVLIPRSDRRVAQVEGERSIISIGEPEYCSTTTDLGFYSGRQKTEDPDGPAIAEVMTVVYRQVTSGASSDDTIEAEALRALELRDFEPGAFPSLTSTTATLFPVSKLAPSQRNGDANVYVWLANLAGVEPLEFELEASDSDAPPRIVYNPWRDRWFCGEDITLTLRENGDRSEETLLVARGRTQLYDVGAYVETFQQARGETIAFLDRAVPGEENIETVTQTRATIYGNSNEDGRLEAASLLTAQYDLVSDAIFYQVSDYEQTARLATRLLDQLQGNNDDSAASPESDGDEPPTTATLGSLVQSIERLRRTVVSLNLPPPRILTDASLQQATEDAESEDEATRTRGFRQLSRFVDRLVAGNAELLELQARLDEVATLFDGQEHLRLSSPYIFLNRTEEFALARRSPPEAERRSRLMLLEDDNVTVQAAAEAEVMKYWFNDGVGLATGDVYIEQDEDQDPGTEPETQIVSNRAIYRRSLGRMDLDGDVIVVNEGNTARPAWARYFIDSRQIEMGAGAGGLDAEVPEDEGGTSALGGLSGAVGGGAGQGLGGTFGELGNRAGSAAGAGAGASQNIQRPGG